MSTIICPDGLCNITCNGLCSYSTIQLQPTTSLILHCQTNDKKTPCNTLDIRTVGNPQNILSTASITCTQLFSSQYACESFNIQNLYKMQFTCNDSSSAGCFRSDLNIINISDVTINCIHRYSCNSMQLNLTNTNTVDIICQKYNSCPYSIIGSDQINSNINMICDDYYACANMQISCFRYNAYGCNISCGETKSCYGIYINTPFNDYVENFVYMLPSAGINNINVNCFNPYLPYPAYNSLVFTTRVSSKGNGTSATCSNNDCCPQVLPTLKNIHCDEGLPCVVHCGQSPSYVTLFVNLYFAVHPCTQPLPYIL